MTVDLPEPFGPRNRRWNLCATEKRDVIDRGEIAEALRQPFAFDHRFVAHVRIHVRENDVGGHAGAKLVLLIRQTDLHAEDLLDPVLDGLDVARSEFGLAIDLLDDAGEILPGNESTRTRTGSPSLIKPSHGSGT